MWWDENKIWNYHDKFPFGKHEGKSLGLVLEQDPQYYLFLRLRFKQFRITKGIHEAVNILMGIDKIEKE